MWYSLLFYYIRCYIVLSYDWYFILLFIISSAYPHCVFLVLRFTFFWLQLIRTRTRSFITQFWKIYLCSWSKRISYIWGTNCAFNLIKWSWISFIIRLLSIIESRRFRKWIKLFACWFIERIHFHLFETTLYIALKHLYIFK